MPDGRAAITNVNATAGMPEVMPELGAVPGIQGPDMVG